MSKLVFENNKLQVKKRTNDVVEFNENKITEAIYRAICDTKSRNEMSYQKKRDLAIKITQKVLDEILFSEIDDNISIESIQDKVEHVLMKGLGDNEDTSDIAKQYILYREEKRKVRKAIANILQVKQLDPISKSLTVNSAGVFESRYLIKDPITGEITETMPQLFTRIAASMAIVDVTFSKHIFEKSFDMIERDKDDLSVILNTYDSLDERDKNPKLNRYHLEHVYRHFMRKRNQISISFTEFFYIMFTKIESKTVIDDIQAYEFDLAMMIDLHIKLQDEFIENFNKYFNLMSTFRFLPNTPTLMNAGTRNGQLCACFTLDMPDSLKGIFKTNSDTAIIFKGAGGVGINYSDLREEGSFVDNVPEAATGPMSFLSIINFFTDIIKQGGKRKGANMGILECIAKGTQISTLKGRVPIEDLVGQEPLLYCMDENNEIRIRKALKVVYNGKRNLLRIRFDDDSILECTPDHKIMLSNGEFKEADQLKQFDSIMAFYKTTWKKRYHVSSTVSKNWINEQSLVAEYKTGQLIKQDGLNRKPTDLCTHHIDGNQLNNDPDNIEVKTISEHSKIHSDFLLKHQKRISNERKGRTIEELYGKEKADKIKQKMSQAKKFSNHKVISIEYLEGEHDVYDIIMKDYHNFVANGVFVHNCWHPDIEKFIISKTIPEKFENYNISVGINQDFWKAFDDMADYELVSPHTKKVVKKVPSHHLMNLIASSAWKSAEPGLINLYNINKYNPLERIKGPIRITNPCAEQAMFANNSCTLGSINLAKYVINKIFNYEKFREDVYTATQFLNNVIDINNYPTPEIEEESIKIRRIGLGFMGLAHAMIKMGIAYNSKEGVEFTEKISSLLTFHSLEKSMELAERRGAHYYWEQLKEQQQQEEDTLVNLVFNGFTEAKLSNFLRDTEKTERQLEKHGIYNTWTTTVAPTGTISMAADTSSGIEPIYKLLFVKNTSIGKFYYLDKEFETVLKENGLYSEELLDKISFNNGSCQGIEEIPLWIQKLFVTSVDIHWITHLMILAAGQKGISNSISKTVNLPAYATEDDFILAYTLSRYMGIKGLALFRDGSRNKQVLDTADVKELKEKKLQNPHDKNLKQIGAAAKEKKNGVIDVKIDDFVMYYINEEIFPKISKKILPYITKTLYNNFVTTANTSLTINTDEKCPLCGSGMIKTSHCTTCSECEYGVCA